MNILKKLTDAVVTRIVMVTLGILIAVFGLITPKRVMEAMSYAILKESSKILSCKDC